MVRVLFIRPLEYPRVMMVSDDLIDVSSIIGGYPYAVTLSEDITLICPAMAGAATLTPNRCLDDGTVICGAFILCGMRNGPLLSLTDAQMDWLYQRFYYPELFFRRHPDGLWVGSRPGSGQSPWVIPQSIQTPQTHWWDEETSDTEP